MQASQPEVDAESAEGQHSPGHEQFPAQGNALPPVNLTDDQIATGLYGKSPCSLCGILSNTTSILDDDLHVDLEERLYALVFGSSA